MKCSKPIVFILILSAILTNQQIFLTNAGPFDFFKNMYFKFRTWGSYDYL